MKEIDVDRMKVKTDELTYDVVDERKQNMTVGWSRVAVSEVATTVLGGTPSRDIPEYWDGDIPWATAKDVANSPGRYLDEFQECITEVGLNSSSAKRLPRGTILITARGTVGALAQLSRDMTFNQTCYAIVPGSRIDNDFLFYALKGSLAEMRALTYGTVFETITKKSFDDWILSLPPMAEQRAIAHILGMLDDKIELNRRMNETLEEMARALFKSWFVDFEPVRAKMERRWRRGESLPGMPAELYDLFPDGMVDSELGEIPEGWEVVPLPDFMDFREGPGIRHWQYTNSPKGTRFINIRCIQNGDLQLGTANRIMTEEADGKYSHFHLKEWDIVVSTSGTLGRSAIVRKAHLPLILNTSVIRFRPIKNRSSFSFICGYLNSSLFLNEMSILASGSVQKNFGPTHLKKMRVLCPILELVERHEYFARALWEQVVRRRSNRDTLISLREFLLPKMISGELRTLY